jgi:hypothetical protein
MTREEPVTKVVTLLESVGYRSLDVPITVGGIPFDFAASLKGETSLDLIAVVDTLAESDEKQMCRRVEGLSRALDLVRSRRPLTVILVGPRPTSETRRSLSRVCRVLVTATPTDDGLDEALAVLLPLDVLAEAEPADSWPVVREALSAQHPGSDIAALLDAATQGQRVSVLG